MVVSLESLVDLNRTSLLVSLLSIIFNPVAWNLVAQNEYRNKTITRLFGGNTYYGCYFLAFLIFSCGIFRDSLYHRALLDQPQHSILPAPYDTVVPAALFLVGTDLRVTGTFLGDYFGILMDHRVEGFPFNVLRDPMYVGSTMSFAATALWYERPAGLFITFYVIHAIVYVVLTECRPFTDMIYSKREAERKKA
ncbi:phospholipid methyltransferase [Mycena olivaceomarginata]|nr:phospholipid methyltransferase [Mycena olivaceomarginata]